VLITRYKEVTVATHAQKTDKFDANNEFFLRNANKELGMTDLKRIT
jgi:hypothetical protein